MSFFLFQVPENFSDFEKYNEYIFNAAKKTVVLREVLKRFHEQAIWYDYELRTSDVTDAIFELDDIGYTHVKETPPTLPPFLKCLSCYDDTSSCSSVDMKSSLSSVEFVSLVCGESEQSYCYFTGCTFITTEDVLLADWSNGLLRLVNIQGILCDKLSLEQSPWDVEFVGDGKAAVTVPKLHKIVLVEKEPSLHSVGYIQTHGECFGISKIGDMYAVTCDPCSRTPSVCLYDENGGLYWKLQTDESRQYLKCPLHVCMDYLRDVVFVSDAGANCVFSVSLQGEILSCFRHKEMDYPMGVHSDRNNCLYVCCKNSSVILKLSADGLLLERFVKTSDQLDNPCALCLHPNGDHFIVTDLSPEKSMGYWKLSTV